MITQIIREIEVLSGKTKETLPGYHIFYRLLGSIENEVGVEGRMHLMWIFTMTEKSLREARKGNVNYCRFHLSEVEKYAETKNELALHAQNFVILPARAFFEYNCLLEFGKAIDSLVDSLRSIDYIVKTGRPKMLAAAVEQYLNICRVLVKMKRPDEAFMEFGSLLYYLFSGISCTSYFIFESEEALNSLTEAEVNQLIEYVTNVALEKCRKSESESRPHYLKRLFRYFPGGSMVRSGSFSLLYGKCLTFMSTPPDELTSSALSEYSGMIASIYILPRMLQYFFLLHLQDAYNSLFGADETLSARIKAYCIDKLGLGYIYEGSSIDEVNSRSPLRDIIKEELQLV